MEGTLFPAASWRLTYPWNLAGGERGRDHGPGRQPQARQGQGEVSYRRRGVARDAARAAAAGPQRQADRYRGADRMRRVIGESKYAGSITFAPPCFHLCLDLKLL